LIAGYRQRNIPVGAVIIDSPWSTAYNDFVWNTNRYPDPAGMIREFHAQGVRVVMWMTGNINSESPPNEVPLTKSPTYDEAMTNGYGVQNSSGKLRWWKGRGLHVDVTNPKAAEWFAKQTDPLLAMGIDGWKADEGVIAVPDPVETHAGMIPKREYMARWYGFVTDCTLRRNPAAVVLVRPYSYQGGFHAPISKCLMGWCGDFGGDFRGLRQQLDNLYRSANSGYGPLTVEVGGYFNTAPSKSELIRYAQFGALTPGMENGGRNGGLEEHLPWWQDEHHGGGTETTDIYRYFATLHSELVPYIFSVGVESHLHRVPMVRNADVTAAQHLLGNDIFVSVLTDAAGKRVVFPKGRWIDYWDNNTVYPGGTSMEIEVPLNRYPIYFRCGATIPLNVRNDVTGFGDRGSAGATTLLIFPSGTTHRTFYRPTGDGVEYTPVEMAVDEAKGTVNVSGLVPHEWILRVHTFVKPRAVQGADSWSYDEKSKCVIARKKGARVEITIEGLKSYG
jgi:alpha-glucosidase (family GH31 glycosyl hydrolase)